MRDYRDAKAMARTLHDALKAKGVSLTHSDSLELVAKTLGFHDGNSLAAEIQFERKPPDTKRGMGKPARQEIPIDATVLDGYVGFYQHPNGNAIMTVTLTRLTGQPHVPI